MSLFVPSARALHGYHYKTCESRPPVHSTTRGKPVGIGRFIWVQKADWLCDRLSTVGTCFHIYNRIILHFNIFLDSRFPSPPHHDNLPIFKSLIFSLSSPIRPLRTLTTCLFNDIIVLRAALPNFPTNEHNHLFFNNLNTCCGPPVARLTPCFSHI